MEESPINSGTLPEYAVITLAQWINGNIGRPAIPQRAAKRQRKNKAMTDPINFMKGQQTLAMQQDGT